MGNESGLIEIRTLGGFEVRSSSDHAEIAIPQPKRTAFLAYLAAAEPRGFHRRDTLLALLWPELSAPKARHGLSQTLYELRSTLPDGVLLTRGDSQIGFNWERVWGDVAALRDHLASGRSEDALALYRGPLLSGFHLSGAPDFERWLETERSHVHERVSDAAWSLADTETDPVEATRLARRAAEFSPFDEGVIHHLLEFLVERGDRAGALDAYRVFANRLSKEYGLEPSPETRALVEGIERGATTTSEHRTPALAVPRGVEQPHQESPDSRKRKTRAGHYSAALVASAAIALVVVLGRSEAPPPPVPNSFVVFPFSVTGDDTTFAWLATGAAMMLTHDLEAWSEVRVLDPRRLAALADSVGVNVTPNMSLGDALRVARVGGTETAVLGEIVSHAGTLEIVLRQYDPRSGDQVGQPVRVDGAAGEDVRVLIDRLATRMLDLKGAGSVTPDLRAATTTSLDAYRRYLEGLVHFYQWEIGDAADAFETAIRRDSTFAQAYYRLAVSTEWLPGRNEFRYELNPEESCELMRAAMRHAADVPAADLRHFEAYHAYVCNPDLALARQLYREIIAADSSDPEAWFHLGNVEYWDEGLTLDTAGNLVMRTNWNVALRSYLRAVEIDPHFHLGYGSAFDIFTTLNTTGYFAIDVTGDGMSGDEPLDQIYTYAAWTDSIEWLLIDPTDSRRVIDQFLGDSATGWIRDTALVLAERWANAAPHLAAPQATLRDVYIEREAYDRALEHERTAFRLSSGAGYVPSVIIGATSEDAHRGRMAALHLAAGNFDSARALGEEILRVQAENRRRAPIAAGNVLAALGQPRRALDEVLVRFTGRPAWLPGWGDEAIVFTESWSLLREISVFGSSGVFNERVTAAMDSLARLWRSSYSSVERGILHWMLLSDQMGPAILLADPETVRAWFAEAAEVDSTSEPRLRRNAEVWRPFRLLIEDSLEASNRALDSLASRRGAPDWDLSATERYVVGTVAQRLGRHEMAIGLFESRVAGAGSGGVLDLNPSWALQTRSYLDRARSYEALGQLREAREAYQTFLSAWRDAETELQHYANEARRAVDRLSGGRE